MSFVPPNRQKQGLPVYYERLRNGLCRIGLWEKKKGKSSYFIYGREGKMKKRQLKKGQTKDKKDPNFPIYLHL